MTWGTTQDPWPDQPDDEYPGYLWPDDDEQDADWPEEAGRPGGASGGVPPTAPVPLRWAPPSTPDPSTDAAERRRRMLALTITAVVAIGFGAGAVLVYRNAQTAWTPPAAASHGTGQAPGQGGGPAGAVPAGPGQATAMELVGQVTAVGKSSITVGGGPMQSVRAAVTNATKFTGTARTLAAVQVGDAVQVEITIVKGTAKVVSLQDPASQS